MINPIVIPPWLEKPVKRLYRQKKKLGSWHMVALARNVNDFYIHELIQHGIIPTNPKIQRALGIRPPKRVTINQLMQLPIQDMPKEILRLAFINREEMK
jgi:hypothetical protein